MIISRLRPPPAALPVGFDRDANTEAYGYRKDNDFLGARDNPLSTFSIDVDTASYATCAASSRRASGRRRMRCASRSW